MQSDKASQHRRRLRERFYAITTNAATVNNAVAVALGTTSHPDACIQSTETMDNMDSSLITSKENTTTMPSLKRCSSNIVLYIELRGATVSYTDWAAGENRGIVTSDNIKPINTNGWITLYQY